MAYSIQWLRSLVFIILMYLAMPLLAIFFTPFAIFNAKYAYQAMHLYCRWVRWSADVIVGLKSEVRGEIPTGEVMIASKHQSFFDILIIFGAVPRAKFIMKAQLIWAPILGYYAYRIGCVFVDRGKRGQAIKKMVADVNSGKQDPGQLVIFPQGTRVAVGDKKPYKIGTAILYQETGQDVVPAATNVGVFWKRHGIFRHPGLAVIEFLPTIKQGLSTEEFMAELETSIEAATDRLIENS